MNYEDVFQQMKAEGSPVPYQRFRIAIPNARQELENVMTAILSSMGERLEWLPEYDRVADWLADNHGKGLFMFGNCGRGKSLLARYAIPAIIRAFSRRIVSVVDCGSQQVNIDEILRRKLIVLDDVGVEVDRIDYGTRRNVVVEAINKAQDDPARAHPSPTILSFREELAWQKKFRGGRGYVCLNGHVAALFSAAPSARGIFLQRNTFCIDQSTFRDYFVAGLLVPLLRNGANRGFFSHKSSKKKEMRSFQGLLRRCAPRAIAAQWGEPRVLIPQKYKEKEECRSIPLFLGALSGTRTLGPLIKSQLLYQLS